MSGGGGHAVGLEGACEAFRRLWGLNLENRLGSQGLGSLMLVCVFYTSLGLCEMGILTGFLRPAFPSSEPVLRRQTA